MVEETLRLALELWLPPNHLQTRICGLYLLYAFYTKQTSHIKSKVWREIYTNVKKIY